MTQTETQTKLTLTQLKRLYTLNTGAQVACHTWWNCHKRLSTQFYANYMLAVKASVEYRVTLPISEEQDRSFYTKCISSKRLRRLLNNQ
jgi:hypothetical protein